MPQTWHKHKNIAGDPDLYLTVYTVSQNALKPSNFLPKLVQIPTVIITEPKAEAKLGPECLDSGKLTSD